MNRELNIHLIEDECEKTTKQEMEARTSKAAELLAQGHSCTVVTTRVTEEDKSSKRQARRITSKVMDLIVQDFVEINIERPPMVAKLLVHTFECLKIDKD